jgi:hypothetical protein
MNMPCVAHGNHMWPRAKLVIAYLFAEKPENPK